LGLRPLNPAGGRNDAGADLWVAEARRRRRDQVDFETEIAGTVLSLAAIRMRLTPSPFLCVGLRRLDLA
jgi:hypothetical protein